MLEAEILGIKYHRLLARSVTKESTVSLKQDYDYSFIVSYDNELFSLLSDKYNIAAHKFDEEKLENQYRYDEPIARKVKFFLNFVLTEAQAEQAIVSFFKLLVTEEDAFARDLYMSKDELIELSDFDALDSHGAAHLPLATKTQECAKNDVEQSINFLEELTGKPINSFSYPYGGAEAVNSSLMPVFDGTNIKFALTMWRGTNGIDNLQNPLFLRRFDTNDIPGGKNNVVNYPS